MRRRQFFATAAAAAAAPLFGRKLQTIGVQLYTVRNIINQEPERVLKALESIGYREAEAVGGNLDAIWPALKATRLKPVSVHIDTALFTTGKDKLPAALDAVKAKGFAYAVCPYIAPKDRGGVDVIRRLAETLNSAGELCRKSGMHLCYHNHAFEFEPAPGGGTLLDVLMQNANSKLVSLELDIMWSQVAGVNPVDVLKKYRGRVALMHVKNVAGEIERRYNEQVPRTAFREAGNGIIDIPAVLEAGQQAGVRHFFVEQDQTPGDPIESLRQSYEYLSKLD